MLQCIQLSLCKRHPIPSVWFWYDMRDRFTYALMSNFPSVESVWLLSQAHVIRTLLIAFGILTMKTITCNCYCDTILPQHKAAQCTKLSGILDTWSTTSFKFNDALLLHTISLHVQSMYIMIVSERPSDII